MTPPSARRPQQVMRSAATIRLGVRLAVAGGRAGIARGALIAAAVGLGVAVLFGVASVGPALANREARAAAQAPSCTTAGTGVRACPVPAGAPNLLEVLVNPGDSFRGRPLTTVHIAVVGSASHLGHPPGVSRLPSPGQLVVSPALSRILTSKDGALLRPRLRGQVIATITQAGLVYPGQLLAYIGAVPPRHPAQGGWEPATGFGAPASPYSITRHAAGLPVAVLLFLVLLAAVVLAPILAFTATATRLSAATRERRLATLRLLGAPPSQVRLLVAVEAGLAAAAGCVVGAVLLLAGRQFLPFVLPGPLMAFPSAFTPPWSQAAAIVLAVPVLALVAGSASLWKVELGPLGVRRRARSERKHRTGPLRLAPLALGLAGLAAMLPYHHALLAGHNPAFLPAAALAVSLSLIVGGVIAAGPSSGVVVAGPLAKQTRSPGVLLGARRLQTDPTSSSRIVGGVIVVAFAATLVLGIAPAFTKIVAPATARRRHGMVTVISANTSAALLRHLAAVPGVRGVVPVETLQTNGQFTQVSVVSCAGLHQILATGAPKCTSGVAAGFYPAGQPRPVPALLRPVVTHSLPAPSRSTSVATGETPGGALSAAADGLSSQPAPFRPFALPARLTPARMPQGTAIPGFGSDLVLTRSAVPTAVFDQMLPYSTVMVLTNGSWQAHQRVRDVVAAVAPGAFVLDSHQISGLQNPLGQKVGKAVGAGLALLLVVAAAGLLIGSLDAVAERRQTLAVLSAAGVPRRTLATSISVATAMPLLGGLAVAEAAALAAAALFQLLVFSRVSLDLAPVAVAAGAALATVAVATLFTMPSLARATSTEGLRTD